MPLKVAEIYKISAMAAEQRNSCHESCLDVPVEDLKKRGGADSPGSACSDHIIATEIDPFRTLTVHCVSSEPSSSDQERTGKAAQRGADSSECSHSGRSDEDFYTSHEPLLQEHADRFTMHPIRYHKGQDEQKKPPQLSSESSFRTLEACSHNWSCPLSISELSIETLISTTQHLKEIKSCKFVRVFTSHACKRQVKVQRLKLPSLQSP